MFRGLVGLPQFSCRWAQAGTSPLLLEARRNLASKTADVWAPNELSPATLTMYTKEGCSLCDDVVDVLTAIRFPSSPSSPRQRPIMFNFKTVDITDRGNEELYDAYKYDIPVVHINGKYWFKHRIPYSDPKSVGEVILRFGSRGVEASFEPVGKDPKESKKHE